jgi:hypothetical protein
MKDKEREVGDKVRLARSNGKTIDMKVGDLFANWADYVKPYVQILKTDIEKLNRIPLNSAIDTKDNEFKGKNLLFI